MTKHVFRFDHEEAEHLGHLVSENDLFVYYINKKGRHQRSARSVSWNESYKVVVLETNRPAHVIDQFYSTYRRYQTAIDDAHNNCRALAKERERSARIAAFGSA